MKSTNKLLSTGDKVELYIGRGPEYRTMLQEITPEGNLVVAMPTYRGIPVIMHEGEEIQLIYYKSSGRYQVLCTTVKFYSSGKLRLVSLKPLEEPKKYQRRGAFRMPVSLNVIVRRADMGPFPPKPDPGEAYLEDYVTTHDISESGVSIITKRDYEMGEKLFLRIWLLESGKTEVPVDYVAQVVRESNIDEENKTKLIGLKYLQSSRAQSQKVSRFIMLEQQKARRFEKMILSD